MDDEIDMASVVKADAIDPERETYYRDDPKKALKRFFDREGMYIRKFKGLYLIYVCVYERMHVSYYYSLPVQSGGGEMVVAEATVKGKRKEAIIQCALDVFQLLDDYRMLKQASQSECV